MTALRNVDTGRGLPPTSFVPDIDSMAKRPVHWVERVFHEHAFNSMAGFFASVENENCSEATLAALQRACSCTTAMGAARVSVSPWRFDGRSTPRVVGNSTLYVDESMLKDAGYGRRGCSMKKEVGWKTLRPTSQGLSALTVRHATAGRRLEDINTVLRAGNHR